MKLEPREIRFIPPTVWSGRGRLWLLGKQNTLHLQETALVIEGEILKQSFPFLDLFFRKALSGWTTITVPYSRILKYRYRGSPILSTIATLFAWSPAVMLLILSPTVPGGEMASYVATVAITAAVATALTAFFHLWLFRRINLIAFRRANGRKTTAQFRIKSQKLQRAFMAALKANRETTSSEVGRLVPTA
jgi:hypothetical protein